MDSLAVLERGYLYPSPGTFNGVKAECPFCIARHIHEYKAGDVGVMLHTPNAGQLLRYGVDQRSGSNQFEWLATPGMTWTFNRDLSLTLPVEVITVPFWLPSLSLRNCFIIDELVVWHFGKGASGDRFHWADEPFIEVVRTCWKRRIPILPSELSKVMLAHGMPEQYQVRVERLFKFGIESMVAAAGRPALKKARSEVPAMTTLYEIWQSQRI